MEPQPSSSHDSAHDDAGGRDAASDIEPTAHADAGNPPPASPHTDDSQADADDESIDAMPSDGLSPSVRRLVRQYDLDVTSIRGTGPDGRIRVADVVALIGTRDAMNGKSDAVNGKGDGPAPARRGAAQRADDGVAQDDGAAQLAGDGAAQRVPATASAMDGAAMNPAPMNPAHTNPAAAHEPAVVPVTTVFECDLGRVLAHRKRQALHGVEPTITSYYLVACGAALDSVPEVGADTERVGEIGVWLGTSDGDAKPLLIDVAAEPPGTPPGERVHGIDLRLRAAATSAVTAAAANPADDPFEGAPTRMLLHQHGAAGSIFTTATPLGPGHAASVGVGRVRKQVVVRNVDGDEGPRVAALAYLTLSFDPRRVSLQRANRFMAELVRVLEHWPVN